MVMRKKRTVRKWRNKNQAEKKEKNKLMIVKNEWNLINQKSKTRIFKRELEETIIASMSQSNTSWLFRFLISCSRKTRSIFEVAHSFNPAVACQSLLVDFYLEGSQETHKPVACNSRQFVLRIESTRSVKQKRVLRYVMTDHHKIDSPPELP